jgi:superfamily II DNA or RNA helicase
VIELRPYQRVAVDAITEAVDALAPRSDRDRLIILTAPTGSGKTVMLAGALHRTACNHAVLWLAHCRTTDL